MAWTNSDGLYVKFGTEEGTVGIAGEYNVLGQEHVVHFELTLSGLGTAAAIQDQHVTLPSGAFITEIKTVATTAATSSGSGTLNLGLQRLDRSTELDYDGLLAAAALTNFDAAGETVQFRKGTTGAGALMGTALAYPGYVTADYDTGAFQTGVLQVEIKYMIP